MQQARPIRIMAALVVTCLLAPATAAAAAEPTPATLTILAQPVEHIAASGERKAATPGMSLHQGDRVVTGAGGLALLTFLDGSTVTVLSDSDVGVGPRASGEADRSRLAVLLHAGKVWARIARLLGTPSGVALESNEYTATARDGLIGAERTRNGGFVCWTRAGELTLADAAGRVLAVVPPERKATVAVPGGAAVVEPFRVNASALRVTVTGNVAPLIRMPGGRGEVGFAPGDATVNHVFGALTAEGETRRLVEVPAGTAGPYTVLLTGLDDGRFTVDIEGLHLGTAVYHRRLSGTIRGGQALATRIEQRMAEGPADPRTARVEDAQVTLLHPVAPVQPLALPAAVRH